MLNLQIIMDAIGVALLAVVQGHLKADPPITQAHCQQLPITVRFPFLTPIQSVARNDPMKEIAFQFAEKKPYPPKPGQTQTTVKGFSLTAIRATSPIFVDFYEKHSAWMMSEFGDKASTWPMLFRFARALRNFISHNAGRVDFDGKPTPPVTWYGLTYSPADQDKLVMGTDIEIGDLIVLMFELSDELDNRGCPLGP